jgi:tRNA-specific 2-thiouridylase
MNWLPQEPLAAAGRRVEVKLRSVSEPAPAMLYPLANGGAEVVLDAAQFGISPGQAAVCYEGTRVLGGGWIAAAESRLAA